MDAALCSSSNRQTMVHLLNFVIVLTVRLFFTSTSYFRQLWLSIDRLRYTLELRSFYRIRFTSEQIVIVVNGLPFEQSRDVRISPNNCCCRVINGVYLTNNLVIIMYIPRTIVAVNDVYLTNDFMVIGTFFNSVNNLLPRVSYLDNNRQTICYLVSSLLQTLRSLLAYPGDRRYKTVSTNLSCVSAVHNDACSMFNNIFLIYYDGWW